MAKKIPIIKIITKITNILSQILKDKGRYWSGYFFERYKLNKIPNMGVNANIYLI